MARRWWLPLVAGVLWILFGMWLFSYRVGSLVALAVLIGITMIFSGFTEILVGPAVPIFRWLFLLAGGLSLAGGAAILVWPGPTATTVAVGPRQLADALLRRRVGCEMPDPGSLGRHGDLPSPQSHTGGADGRSGWRPPARSHPE
jgi:hypothetical protein